MATKARQETPPTFIEVNLNDIPNDERRRLWDSEVAISEHRREADRLREEAKRQSGRDRQATLEQIASEEAEIKSLNAAIDQPTLRPRPAGETPAERRARLLARSRDLGGTRQSGVTARLAKEEGVKPSMIRRLIAEARKAIED